LKYTTYNELSLASPESWCETAVPIFWHPVSGRRIEFVVRPSRQPVLVCGVLRKARVVVVVVRRMRRGVGKSGCPILMDGV
jgi:hypothetical protein